jgi:hypothetical protein
MRCECCDKNLNDWESTAKDLGGRYLNTCNGCLKGSGIPVLGRPDLERMEMAPTDWEGTEDIFLDDPYEDGEV